MPMRNGKRLGYYTADCMNEIVAIVQRHPRAQDGLMRREFLARLPNELHECFLHAARNLVAEGVIAKKGQRKWIATPLTATYRPTKLGPHRDRRPSEQMRPGVESLANAVLGVLRQYEEPLSTTDLRALLAEEQLVKANLQHVLTQLAQRGLIRTYRHQWHLVDRTNGQSKPAEPAPVPKTEPPEPAPKEDKWSHLVLPGFAPKKVGAKPAAPKPDPAPEDEAVKLLRQKRDESLARAAALTEALRALGVDE